MPDTHGVKFQLLPLGSQLGFLSFVLVSDTKEVQMAPMDFVLPVEI